MGKLHRQFRVQWEAALNRVDILPSNTDCAVSKAVVVPIVQWCLMPSEGLFEFVHRGAKRIGMKSTLRCCDEGVIIREPCLKLVPN